jgi:hypothetical protein
MSGKLRGRVLMSRLDASPIEVRPRSAPRRSRIAPRPGRARVRRGGRSEREVDRFRAAARGHHHVGGGGAEIPWGRVGRIGRAAARRRPTRRRVDRDARERRTRAHLGSAAAPRRRPRSVFVPDDRTVTRLERAPFTGGRTSMSARPRQCVSPTARARRRDRTRERDELDYADSAFKNVCPGWGGFGQRKKRGSGALPT